MALIRRCKVGWVRVFLLMIDVLDWALCSSINVATISVEPLDPNLPIIKVLQLARLVRLYLFECNPLLMFLVVSEVF